jgi:hypothetical protein
MIDRRGSPTCARRTAPHHRHRARACPTNWPSAASSLHRHPAGRSSPIRSGARWSANPSPSSSCPTFSASASSSDGGGLLPRARRRPHQMALRAGPLQGLHLDAEAERLPLHPHHGRRPGRQRVELQIRTEQMDDVAAQRHRRPCALQGWTRRTTIRPCRTREIRRLCLAAPHDRDAGRGRQPRGVSSSTPSSSCSTIRCSASRRRAG